MAINLAGKHFSRCYKTLETISAENLFPVSGSARMLIDSHRQLPSEMLLFKKGTISQTFPFDDDAPGGMRRYGSLNCVSSNPVQGIAHLLSFFSVPPGYEKDVLGLLENIHLGKS